MVVSSRAAWSHMDAHTSSWCFLLLPVHHHPEAFHHMGDALHAGLHALLLSPAATATAAACAPRCRSTLTWCPVRPWARRCVRSWRAGWAAASPWPLSRRQHAALTR